MPGPVRRSPASGGHTSDTQPLRPLSDLQQVDSLQKANGLFVQLLVLLSQAKHLVADQLQQRATSSFEILVEPWIEGDDDVGVLVGLCSRAQARGNHAHKRRLPGSPTAGHAD